MRKRLINCFMLVAMLLPIVIGVSPAMGATGDPVLINEVLASHSGTDDTEFIELYGTPGHSLDGLSLIVVESDAFGSGTIDRRYDFKPFQKMGPNGFFLFGNCGGLPANYGVTPDASLFNNYFENSSLTIALVETTSLSGGSVTGSEIVLDTVALNDGDAGDTFFFGAAVIGPDGPNFPAGARRVADGVDTDTAADWVISSFSLPGGNTPTGGGFDGCAPIPLTISEIQGSGFASPYEDQTVRTQGVVFADFDETSMRGFFIQDEDCDGDPSTSDGVFVYKGNMIDVVSAGDLVEVRGTVQEYNELTEISTSLSNITVLSSGNPLPAPVPLMDLPNESIAEGIAFWEPLEGMLVSVRNAFVVAPTSGYGEFGMLTETDADADLYSGYFAQTKQILIRSLGGELVDYNPERILVDDSSLDEPINVMPGDRVRSLVGAVDYTFGNYKLQPISYDVKTHRLPNLPASTRSGRRGNTVITTFNVENLFDLVDNPDKEDESSTPSPEELEIQLKKLALAIQVELELPEIIVVQEVENTEILQELGNRVNTAAGTDYVATSFETSDVRGIEVGFLWDANRVDLVDAYQMSGLDVEVAFGPSSPSPGREPLVGVFDVEGYEVTIIGNHFKSKSGDDALFGMNQPPIRITEVQRKMQAGVVRDFVDTILDADPDALVMVAGDLNDFQFGEPGEGPDHPVAILEGVSGGDPLINLLNLEKAAETYTYVYDGNSEVLDHMLVSPALYDLFVAVDILHFNASYPYNLGGDPNTPLGASDHDPLEGRFRFR